MPLPDPAPLEVFHAALHALMQTRGVKRGGSPIDLVEQARAPHHKLAITLASLLERDGVTLPAALSEELAHHRRRIERYAWLWEQVRTVAPHAYVVKGSQIARSYPEGVLRSAGDLDVICPDQRELWAAACMLMDQGWDLHALTVVADHADGEPHVLMDVCSDADVEIFGIPYVIELRTVDIATSLRRSARRLSGRAAEPLPRNVLSLLAERWERRFTSRDLLDLALLLRGITADGELAVSEALDQSDMWPEWGEAARILAGFGWLPRLGLLTTGRSPGRDLVVRLRRLVVEWGHPVRAGSYLAQSTVDAERGRLADWLAGHFQRRVGGQRLLRLGVPLFGVPMQTNAAGERTKLALVRRHGHLVGKTPIGDFLLVTGACRHEWLVEAMEPGSAPS